jgi:hypothetical protein
MPNSAQPRDGETFTRLLLQNQKRIAGLIYSLVPQGADADDVMQESLEVHVHDAAGREVAATPCAGLTPATPAALGLGVKLDASGAHPERNTPGFWDGVLDELAIFHRALNAAEILSLYDAAR